MAFFHLIFERLGHCVVYFSTNGPFSVVLAFVSAVRFWIATNFFAQSSTPRWFASDLMQKLLLRTLLHICATYGEYCKSSPTVNIVKPFSYL